MVWAFSKDEGYKASKTHMGSKCSTENGKRATEKDVERWIGENTQKQGNNTMNQIQIPEPHRFGYPAVFPSRMIAPIRAPYPVTIGPGPATIPPLYPYPIWFKNRLVQNDVQGRIKKVLDSERSGVGTDDVYVPHLWYFELLSFLRDQESPRTSVSNMEDDNETQNSETHGVQSEDNSSQPATPHSIISEPLTPRPIPQATSRAAKMRNDKCDEVLDVTQKRFTMPSDVDAKFTLIGKAWACKLKELSQVQATRNSKSLLYLAYTTSIIQSANSTVFTTRVIIKSSNHAIFADASFTNRTILSAPDTIKFTNTSAIFSFFCL
ncbi:unnamed protein product [Acanthoscelides obtectus]|uniref:Uncharacterized protein n=1 Tax=Acanthoscelides obtectus TaxID=200917 RepID=A0A9P0Q9N0_ACAOB|nr:unnamed protein product [Acanthoscelides obtectus]CAK1683539.1 hypothetical protein AOBTE_LOCUS34297 [Acanthoscelides obtectus]